MRDAVSFSLRLGIICTKNYPRDLPIDNYIVDPSIERIELVVINLQLTRVFIIKILLGNLKVQFPLYSFPVPVNPDIFLKLPIIRHLRLWN
jgi:hypothetical protein